MAQGRGKSFRDSDPLGTACISFEREYPDQTFAGFISSAQESLTMVARKTIPLLIAALSLFLTTSHSHAGLGWTIGPISGGPYEGVANQFLCNYSPKNDDAEVIVSVELESVSRSENQPQLL